MGRAEYLVEHYLVEQVKRKGGEIRKLAWVGRSGAPDRVVFLPHGQIMFVECKSDVGKLSRQQLFEHATLLKVGVKVHVVSTREQVDALLA